MQAVRTSIPDVLILEPKVFGDDRGFFYESYNERRFLELTQLERAPQFVQDNHSKSAQNVLRGLHYQIRQAQGKLVRVTAGEVFDVAVDIRRSSPTFGHWVGVTLSAANQRQLWIPAGFAHGFVVISESAEFLYKTTDYWAPEHERCIIWNDPAIAIEWPQAGPPLLSGKDSQGKLLADAEGIPLKILLTGKTGQVGYQLARSLQGLGEVVAVNSTEMDLSRLDQVRQVIREIKPDLIVNPAAYTAVDLAEREPELAMRINGEAPAVMAEEAKRLGAAMIHYSTDYVFDGAKDAPYTEEDLTNPLNVYGQSKLAGERAVQAAGIPHLILRTSWVYGMRGKNFLLTVMRLAQERDELRIVDDQYGAPTWSRTIADTTAHIVGRLQCSEAGRSDGLQREAWQRHAGLYHLTAQGKTTWCGFTQAILAHPSIIRKPLVTPIKSEEYPVPARRPKNSVLSCERLMHTFCSLPSWNKALELCQE